MEERLESAYILHEKDWKGKPCPHCQKPAVIHGWLYWEKDADGYPIPKVEIWEHEDGSRHQMWKKDGVPTVEFKNEHEG